MRRGGLGVLDRAFGCGRRGLRRILEEEKSFADGGEAPEGLGAEFDVVYGNLLGDDSLQPAREEKLHYVGILLESGEFVGGENGFVGSHGRKEKKRRRKAKGERRKIRGRSRSRRGNGIVRGDVRLFPYRPLETLAGTKNARTARTEGSGDEEGLELGRTSLEFPPDISLWNYG